MCTLSGTGQPCSNTGEAASMSVLMVAMEVGGGRVDGGATYLESLYKQHEATTLSNASRYSGM